MKPASWMVCVSRAALLAVLSCLIAGGAKAQTGYVAVEISQYYDYRAPSERAYQVIENFELPLLDVVEDMVFATGRDVVDVDPSNDRQTTIEIDVEGRALSRNYFEADGRHLYTGAQISGEVLLITETGVYYHRRFTSLIPMPFSLAVVNLGYDQPHNAPFDKALDRANGFARAVAEVMIAAWGVEAVIPVVFDAGAPARADVANLLGDIGDTVAVPDLIDVLLLDDEEQVRREAAWSLGRIGDDRAIPDLIDALNDSSGDVRWFVAWSLRTLTGEDYGPDYETWSDWWAEQDVPAEG